MSMQEYPNSGYLIEAKKLSFLFPKQYVELIDKEDTEELAEFLDEHWPQDFPRFSCVFQPKDEDTVDEENVKTGGIYIVFQEDDLYERKPKESLLLMRQKGLDPEFANWSVWG